MMSIPISLSEFLCTKKGIQEIKKFLYKSNTQLTLKIIDILNEDGLKKVMTNNQGNFLMQNIIKNSDILITNFIIKYISSNFIEIANNNYGNYVIQKIIEKIQSSSNEKSLILNAIKNREIELVFNEYGMYVLQKIILVISDNKRPDLNKTIINNIVDIILDSYGIHIFNSFIVTCTIDQNKKLILEKIKQNFSKITKSVNGINAMKFLFEIWGGVENLTYITDEVINNIDDVSYMQFLSQVIDIIMKVINNNDKQNLFIRIFFNDIKKYLSNKYGCIVLNKIVKVMDLFWKVKVKYFLIECLKDEFFSNEEKNKIKNVIKRIK